MLLSIAYKMYIICYMAFANKEGFFLKKKILSKKKIKK